MIHTASVRSSALTAKCDGVVPNFTSANGKSSTIVLVGFFTSLALMKMDAVVMNLNPGKIGE